MARKRRPPEGKLEFGRLVLGWTVNRAFEPVHWIRQGAVGGDVREEDLVSVGAEKIAAHTAVIAQSGSGKSFFLGRLLEEMLLQSKVRCLVFDPNGDFRRISRVKPGSAWKKAGYDRERRRGFLPTEKSPSEFKDQWTGVSTTVRTRGSGAHADSSLSVRWSEIPIVLLAGELNPAQRGDLENCHAFVRVIENLAALSGSPISKLSDLMERARELLRDPNGKDDTQYDQLLRGTFPEARLDGTADGSGHRRKTRRVSPAEANYREWVREQNYRSLLHQAVRTRHYVSGVVQEFYFSRMHGLSAAGLIDGSLTTDVSLREAIPPRRLEVIDLASLGKTQDQSLLVHAIASAERARCRDEWEAAMARDDDSADERVPTFVVVDEAHNLMPANPSGGDAKAVLEQFRTIAAEGRKYGLFLVVVSQRPDKLDPVILGECENVVVMRVSGRRVLDQLVESLAIEDISARTLETCLELEQGRALLAGQWAPKGGLFFCSAARRTVEGGRNLRREHWATPIVWESPAGC